MPAYVYAARRDWAGYFDVMANTPARGTLVEALRRLEAEGLAVGELAVDLGCGEGRDTVELLNRGWRVVAIDSSPDAAARVAARCGRECGRESGAGWENRLSVRSEAMEGLTLPRVKLVNASFTLPFCAPGAFAGLWAEIEGAIVPGGRFAGQFFGDRDSWAEMADRTHHNRKEVERMLGGFEIEMLAEEEKPSKESERFPKYWHVFHVVAKRR